MKKTNEKAEKMFDLMKEDLNSEVEEVRYTDRLKKHPVCLTNEGEISVEMEKVMNAMPTDDERLKLRPFWKLIKIIQLLKN